MFTEGPLENYAYSAPNGWIVCGDSDCKNFIFVYFFNWSLTLKGQKLRIGIKTGWFQPGTQISSKQKGDFSQLTLSFLSRSVLFQTSNSKFSILCCDLLVLFMFRKTSKQLRYQIMTLMKNANYGINVKNISLLASKINC